MRTHYLQHVPFEGLGSIKPWLEQAGHHITHTALYQQTILPSVDDFDFLIIMGGPMSVNDETAYPWLLAEKKLIQQAIHAGKSVLGICLGAQLIASAMGSRIYPNAQKEIGWFPIQAVTNLNPDAFIFPAISTVFHWHGETFDLPPQAIHLAKSTACTHQAFQIGQRVIGLQFHLETTPDSLQAMLTHCHNELVPAPYIQDVASLKASKAEYFQHINQQMCNVLSFLSRR